MTNKILITIITEDVLAPVIEKEIEQLGAKGYTVSSVTGKSMDRTRDNPWEGENIKIETITNEEISQKIMQHLQKKYFERYAMIVFSHPVQVIRSNHF